MASLDYAKLPILEKPLYTPPLEEIVYVLSRGLLDTFESVTVTAEESPDLTQSPYNLTSPGLSGNARLIDIGDISYLQPVLVRDKLYDLVALLRHLRRNTALLTGAGAGPWPYVGVNSEGIINLSVRNGSVVQGTRVVCVDPVGAPKGSSGYQQRLMPDDETRMAALGNYLLSDGKPGKVIKVVVKKRIGETSDFVQAIRETLQKHYGDKVVGLGGLFVLKEGTVRHHVMPKISETPLWTDADLDNWLHYFDMPAPITYVGTLLTGHLGLKIRVQHFHGFSEHGNGGHYHNDTTPDTVEYEGYFVPADALIRVDQPAK